jgi:hypothetical protein
MREINMFEGRSSGFTRNCTFIAVVFASLIFSARAQASPIGDLVQNYPGEVWAAFYNVSDIGPDGLSDFHLASATQLVINDTFQPDGKEIVIEDPDANLYFGELSLTVNFDGHGNATSGSISEKISPDGNGDDLQNVFYNSGVLAGFGEIGTTGDYWFSFSNPATPGQNNFSGFIDDADVKTFVPEPSSMLIMGGLASILGTGRFRRRTSLQRRSGRVLFKS